MSRCGFLVTSPVRPGPSRALWYWRVPWSAAPPHAPEEGRPRLLRRAAPPAASHRRTRRPRPDDLEAIVTAAARDLHAHHGAPPTGASRPTSPIRTAPTGSPVSPASPRPTSTPSSIHPGRARLPATGAAPPSAGPHDRSGRVLGVIRNRPSGEQHRGHRARTPHPDLGVPGASPRPPRPPIRPRPRGRGSPAVPLEYLPVFCLVGAVWIGRVGRRLAMRTALLVAPPPGRPDAAGGRHVRDDRRARAGRRDAGVG